MNTFWYINPDGVVTQTTTATPPAGYVPVEYVTRPERLHTAAATCLWQHETEWVDDGENDSYRTSCNHAHPVEGIDSYKYCPYCGKPIRGKTI